MKGKEQTNYVNIDAMPLAEFARRVGIVREQAQKLVTTVHELFPMLVTLTTEQRKSLPRLRTGEHAMLAKVLDVVDRFPQHFQDLADEDEGMDPNKFETQLLRDRIEKHRLLTELTDTLGPISGHFSDTSLNLASDFRDALLSAYRIAKTLAAKNQTISSMLAPVMDFMRQSVVTRAANKKGE